MFRTALSAIGLIGGTLLLASGAWAQADYTWIGPVGGPSGTFGDPNAWDLAAVPGALDRALFNLPAAYTVTFADGHSTDRLRVEQGAVTFALDGHTYNVLYEWHDPDPWNISVCIGATPATYTTSQLTITGGRVNSMDVQIAEDPLNTGELVIGAGGSWSALMHNLDIGVNGHGALTVEDGGTIENGAGIAAIGVDSAATITVTDPGSVWLVTGMYTLGERGSATLTVEEGGTVRIGRLVIGHLREGPPNASGAIIVDGPGSLLDIRHNGEPDGLVIGQEASGSVTVLGGGRLNARGLVRIAQSEQSQGTLTVSGAGSRADLAQGLIIGDQGNGRLTVEGGATLAIGWDVSVSSGPFSQGTLTVTGPGSAFFTTADGYMNVGPDGTGTMNITSGGMVVSSSGFVANHAGSRGQVLVDGPGSMWDVWHYLWVGGDGGGPGGQGSLTVSNGGVVRVTNAETTVYGPSTVYLDRGTLDARGGLRNLGGQIQMLSDGSMIMASYLVNEGILHGRGTVAAPLLNQNDGLVRAAAGERLLFFSADANTNAAGCQISLLGGTIEFASLLTNQPGAKITGRGTLGAWGGLENRGQMLFSGGNTDVFGEVQLLGGAGGGEVITSGTGSVTTFYDEFEHRGDEVRTAKGCTTVFFGDVYGPGNFTGGGTVWFEAGYFPGGSPADVSFEGDVALGPAADLLMELAGRVPGLQYDQLDIAGLFTADGTLDVTLLYGFTPQAGDLFDLFNFAALDGRFDTIHLPDLAPGLAWDTSGLYSTGAIGVVPEPATLALLALGAAGAFARRRRQ
ncbi:MAG: PEP-CTERM sorting domain-containing protein [Planctomycetota bacterium]|nr:PEP-CTERM sorting domain-containing protein [Planctomycetota bacterium]